MLKNLILISIVAVLLSKQLSLVSGSNLICYYDSAGFYRDIEGKFAVSDLEIPLQFCTHLIYGYAGITSETFELKTLNQPYDKEKHHIAEVLALKHQHPDVKFMLSIGGDRDLDQGEKYMQLLEAGKTKQRVFIDSVLRLLRAFNFDGLDLAYQFLRNKPRKVHSEVGSTWKSFKKFFTGDFVVDKEAATHKEQFTDLVYDLSGALKADNKLLSLTVLPNVNSSWYFNAPGIKDQLDFINLAAYDFLTPERNPEEADYTAPIYEPEGQNRLSHYNLDFQVQHWLTQRVPASKINVGVPAYGRAWKLSDESGTRGTPVVPETLGAAPGGPMLKKSGLLSWPEVCRLLINSKASYTDALLHRVGSKQHYGTYAYRVDREPIWVSYEDPETASHKAEYAHEKFLGGVALYDLTTDDFRGTCTGDKFPILRAIKYRL